MKPLVMRDKDLYTLRRTLRQFPCVREVLLFGSRAAGRARRSSDIDLAISAPVASATEWLDLVHAIQEAPIIYEFDILQTESTHNPSLLEKIAREGVAIYPDVVPP